MHDPATLAFSVKSPFKRKGGYRNDILNIWHVDPCKGPGGDDTCGWFMRSYHGDEKVLKKIESRFEFDWDRVFKSDCGKTYFSGYFKPDGSPAHSVHSIGLNLFFLAALEVFKSRRQADRFMKDNLFDILIFAENPVDSMHDGITCKFSDGVSDPKKRAERIHQFASMIYGWILRHSRPWYKHPRWHIHHWKIEVPFLRKLKRWMFTKCCKCGKGFYWNECPTSDWHGTKLWHGNCHGTTVSERNNLACN